MQPSTTTYTTMIANTFANLGIQLPKDITAAQERAQRIGTIIASITSDRDALAVAVIAAADAGNDPAADATVQSLIATERLTQPGLKVSVDQITTGAVQDVLIRNSDKLIQLMRAPFDRSAAALTAAHERFGPVDLSDTTQIIRLGGDVADVWAKAAAGLDRINQISDAWGFIAELTRVAPAQRATLRITDAGYEAFNRLDLGNRRLNAWQVLTEGLTLDLANAATFKGRSAAIEEGARKAAADLRELQKNEYRAFQR